MSLPLAGWRIGFIGLGRMGRPMCARLQAAGATLALWSRSGGGTHPSPAAVAAASTLTILCVADSPAVRAVAAGAEGVLAGVPHGGLIVDMGTTEIPLTRALAEQAQASGAHWLDAPVSGGVGAAESGSLTVMIGGDAAAITQAMPVLEQLGQRLTHVGGAGAGQIAKTANQMIVGLTIAAVSEALVLGQRAGVDPARIRDAIRGGFAESRVLELHGERMVTHDFTPRARIATQAKDMRQAAAFADGLGLDLPVTALVRDLFAELEAAGQGDSLDHSGFITRYGW